MLLGAIASGPSVIRNLSEGLDNVASLGIIEAVGARVRRGHGTVTIEGVGLDGLTAPENTMWAGNSGTTMRLGAGLLCAQRFSWRMEGDTSLSGRPMLRVTEPLRSMGARVRGVGKGSRASDEYAPLESDGVGGALRPISFESPVASAQVKSAVLLAALWADGSTGIREPSLSRDHTERMLRAMGAPIATQGPIVHIDPAGWDRTLCPLDLTIPGDLSSAAFFLVAAAATGSGPVEIAALGVNPTRTGVLNVLRDAGTRIVLTPRGDEGGEPVGRLVCGGPVRHPIRLGGELTTRSIDELPTLVALAAVAPGISELRDARELRFKESDRIAAMKRVLSAFGVTALELPDGLRIEGTCGRPLQGGARIDSEGDHRIAMSAAILGLCADGETIVDDTACVDTSFPGFLEALRGLGADAEEVGE